MPPYLGILITQESDQPNPIKNLVFCELSSTSKPKRNQPGQLLLITLLQKKRISYWIILIYPNVDEPFILTTDTSAFAFFSQGPIRKVLRFVCVSRTWCKAESVRKRKYFISPLPSDIDT